MFLKELHGKVWTPCDCHWHSRGMIPLIGYTDKLSARPGDTVQVKVSSTESEPYRAELVRVICGDPNPAGPGMQTVPVKSDFEGTYPSRPQLTVLGSHMAADLGGVNSSLPPVITISAQIWPTLPGKGRQGIIHLLRPDGTTGFALAIGPDGAEAIFGDTTLCVTKPLRRWAWYRVWATLDLETGKISVGQTPLGPPDLGDDNGTAQIDIDEAVPIVPARLIVAALDENQQDGHFNGKIEDPAIYAGPAHDGSVLAAWDFSENMHSLSVPGKGPLASSGTLHGAPARAMKGAGWDGTQMSWHHAPEQYAAIHFHDDDIADCGWETDFTFTVPDDLKSGTYAVKLTCGDDWDMMPVFICPPKGMQSADVCLVISTFTYVIYANQARADFGPHWTARAKDWGAFPYNPAEYPDYGLSTYNDHEDASGICHTTWHRPILNLRPGYHAFGDDFAGSGLRHFPADTHLLAWFENRGIPFDVVTDWELHHEGAALLAPYKTVLTTSHPEYHTTETLDGFQGYRDNGGKLVYLGGNGFYWRVALHPEKDGLIEIRRAEGGLRAWAADPGEYYHAFNDEYGGIWRRNGRPPQQMVGIGYTVQGEFEGTYYRRKPASYDPDIAWIFEGIDDDVLGDFGLNGGGAAGYELDRTDDKLGTPLNTRVLATSENHPDHFVMPPEEWLTHLKTWSGPPAEELIRADMVYLDCPGGGAVFSVGSITFCGSLPVNGFDNNISRILENVVRGFSGQQTR